MISRDSGIEEVEADFGTRRSAKVGLKIQKHNHTGIFEIRLQCYVKIRKIPDLIFPEKYSVFATNSASRGSYLTVGVV